MSRFRIAAAAVAMYGFPLAVTSWFMASERDGYSTQPWPRSRLWEAPHRERRRFQEEFDACFLLRRAGWRVLATADRHLRVHLLTRSRFNVLYELKKSEPHPRHPSDLAAAVGIRRSSLSDLIGRMECDGLVVRTRDPADGRRRLVWPTEHGITVLEIVLREHDLVVRLQMSQLAPDQLRTLSRSLKTVLRTLPAIPLRSMREAGIPLDEPLEEEWEGVEPARRWP